MVYCLTSLAGVVGNLPLGWWLFQRDYNYLYLFYWIPMVIYLVMSKIAYDLYEVDKYRARTGGRRIPEKDLHNIEMSGGWPGALIAQDQFKHKNNKPQFQEIWNIVFCHFVLWVIWIVYNAQNIYVFYKTIQRTINKQDAFQLNDCHVNTSITNMFYYNIKNNK